MQTRRGNARRYGAGSMHAVLPSWQIVLSATHAVPACRQALAPSTQAVESSLHRQTVIPPMQITAVDPLVHTVASQMLFVSQRLIPTQGPRRSSPKPGPNAAGEVFSKRSMSRRAMIRRLAMPAGGCLRVWLARSARFLATGFPGAGRRWVRAVRRVLPETGPVRWLDSTAAPRRTSGRASPIQHPVALRGVVHRWPKSNMAMRNPRYVD